MVIPPHTFTNGSAERTSWRLSNTSSRLVLKWISYSEYRMELSTFCGIQRRRVFDNYNGNIKEIMFRRVHCGWYTPLDYAYGNNKSPIKNDIVALLRKYGGKACKYDKNGNNVGYR